MVFCNPNPIAAASYLGKEVVTSALQAFSEAVVNLTQLGKNSREKTPYLILE